ncbi:MAG: sulfatase-like hydrolase/transferase [Alphaproteobacteria bacterium]
MMKRKNLVVFHLESIAWQILNAFPEAFPNLNRVMPTARVFRSYFSSATSTQMVIAYLLHGNDFEFDAANRLSKPAENNPSLFSILRAAGYRTEFLCVTALQAKRMLPLLADSLPPVWSTNDFGKLLDKFEKLTAAQPFAIYAWNLVTHIEHSLALAPHAGRIDELVGGACAVADHALGLLMGILERRKLLDDSTIVIFGDHGDAYWTHGFKAGQLHGIEPYSHLVHAPLLIRDASLQAGNDNRLASTIDLAPTCLELLNISSELPFADSGQSLLGEGERICVFSQNFTGNQADHSDCDVRKSFAASDHSHTLLVSSRGLELFNHKLDSTNHCNLLHFFDMDREGDLVPQIPAGISHPHFATAMRYMLGSERTINQDFRKLRTALKEQIGKKHAYIAARAPAQIHTLDLSCLETISTHDRDRFFGKVEDTVALVAETLVVPAKHPPARSLLGGIMNAVFRAGGNARH